MADRVQPMNTLNALKVFCRRKALNLFIMISWAAAPDQWPQPVKRSFSKMNQSLYVTMQGPSEFGISGKLVNWDVSASLPLIKTPTLTIGGRYDTMDPEHMKWMSTQVQNGESLICPNGSHMSMYDDQQVYMTGLIRFLKAVDDGSFHPASKK